MSNEIFIHFKGNQWVFGINSHKNMEVRKIGINHVKKLSLTPYKAYKSQAQEKKKKKVLL